MSDATLPRSTYTRDCGQQDCPGHRMCFACRSDVCTEESCGGCACPDDPCAWASYRPDCEPWDEDWPPDTVVALAPLRLAVVPGGGVEADRG